MANLPKPRLIAAVVGVVILIAVGAGLTAYLLRDAGTEVADHRTDDAEAIEGARIAVTGRLPEAQSVNFGKVFVHWDDEIPSVCGQVDIIEAQDNFEGAERFIWSQSALTLEEIDGSDGVNQKWSDLCV